jgi:hypothetical protein
MPKITEEELDRVIIIITRRDHERLKALVAAGGKSKNHIVRAMLHTALNQIEAMQNAEIDYQESKQHNAEGNSNGRNETAVAERVLHSPADA